MRVVSRRLDMIDHLPRDFVPHLLSNLPSGLFQDFVEVELSKTVAAVGDEQHCRKCDETLHGSELSDEVECV